MSQLLPLTGAAIDPPAFPKGIVTIRRSSVRLLATIVREPLAAIPRRCFDSRVVLARNLGRLRAYVCDPSLVHEALVRNADALEKSAEMKRVLRGNFGDGLLTADGAHWRSQRHAMAPTFQQDRLQTQVPAMIAAAEATRDRWLALPPGAIIDVGHEMMQTTFAIILDTMLSGRDGIDAHSVEHGVADFLRATPLMFALAMVKAPHWTPFPGKRRLALGTRRMRGAVEARVAARRHEGTTGSDLPDMDLLDMLLAAFDPETGQAMSDTEITDNILTFIAAGHETTALALTWSFALLAEHPDCLARLTNEIEEVCDGGPLQPEHIGRLAYTRQVVSEAMRLYPPAPIIARAATRHIEIGGVSLPAGAIIFVPIYAIHRHEGLWARPDIFDPGRFASDASQGRHRFAFMPFGAGRRICIGSSFAMLEAVSILAVLTKALRLERVAPTRPEPQMRVTLRPKHPLHMRVVPR